jgi:hypothetical protein
MKNLLFLFFVLTSCLFGQVYVSSINSTTTPLAGNATFTGVKEKISNFNNVYPQSIVNVVVKSNQSGTGKIQFSADGTIWNTTIPFTYTANDTLTNITTTAVVLPYVRVVYTNGNSLQTSFKLETTFANLTNALVIPNGPTVGNQLISMGYIHPATVSLSKDSVSITAGAIDSSFVTTGCTTWFSFKAFSIDGTILTSLNKNFTTSQIAYPWCSTNGYDHFSPIIYTKVYIKNVGVSTAHVNGIAGGY